MSEEFKAIVELIDTASVGAIWCFVAYLTSEILTVLIGFIGAGVLLKMIATSIKKIMGSLCKTEVLLKKLRSQLGCGSSGCLSDREIERIDIRLSEIIRDSNNQDTE